MGNQGPVSGIGQGDSSLGIYNKWDKYKKILEEQNPAAKQGAGAHGAFVAFATTLNDFSRTGTVPGYSDVSIHTQA